MRARSLFVAAMLVLLAHVGLLQALSQRGTKSAAAASNRPVRSLVRLVRVAHAGGAPAADAAGPSAKVAPKPRLDAVQQAAVPRAAAEDVSGAPPAGDAVYRPGTVLDAPVRARSAPDLSMLSDLPWSGLPLRLRLFIDADGVVVDTQVLQSAEAQEVVERVREMFLATSFTAGTENGKPVPCFKDIELNVGMRS